MTKTPQLSVDGGFSLNPLSKVALTPILNAFNEDPESAFSALPWLDKNKEIRQQIRDMLFDVESQDESDEIHFWSIVHDESKEFVGLIGLGDELQLLHYRSDDGQGHYDWHVDIGHGTAACRKLSLSIMLSPEDKYKGGDLEVDNHGTTVKAFREQGSINMFPSYMLHRVTPVTEGERWVLVIWINGSDRFK